MRVSALIIGLLIGVLLVVQSATIGISKEAPVIDDATILAGKTGLIMALFWLVASGLVIPFPMVSVIFFGLTIPLGLLMPAGEFADLRFHGIVAVVMTGLSYCGWRAGPELNRERYWDTLPYIVGHQQYQTHRDVRGRYIRGASGVFCTTCGVQAQIIEQYCGDCGTRLRQLAAGSA